MIDDRCRLQFSSTLPPAAGLSKRRHRYDDANRHRGDTPSTFSVADFQQPSSFLSQTGSPSRYYQPENGRDHPSGSTCDDQPIRILFEDPDDHGFTMEVYVHPDRPVRGVLQFVDDAGSLELLCDGKLVKDVMLSFRVVTEGYQGCLFSCRRR